MMLRNYRTTPHQSTGETPAMMLMHRELRTKLPSVKSNKSYDDTRAQQMDAKAKQQAKEYADGKRRAREKDFKIGDKVLLRQPHTNKYSTQFSSVPVPKINTDKSTNVTQHTQRNTMNRLKENTKKMIRNTPRMNRSHNKSLNQKKKHHHNQNK
jgi:hypothetical protein